MKSTRAMFVAVGLLVPVMAAGEAEATITSGTFSGIAENARINAAGMSVAFGSDGSTLDLPDGSAGQSVLLEADSFDPYHSGVLDLAGPAGSFFSNLDIATFYPGLVDLANSSASFFDSRDFGARTIIRTDFQSPGPVVAAVSARIRSFDLDPN